MSWWASQIHRFNERLVPDWAMSPSSRTNLVKIAALAVAGIESYDRLNAVAVNNKEDIKNMEFQEFPKIPRLNRDCVITEKIDGTNAQIFIPDLVDDLPAGVPFLCGSRNRWITPQDDNQGFANWAYKNQEELLKLGPGHHYGEWWGQGIARNYGLKEKRFSLFNVHRWGDNATRPSCCGVVPQLFDGPFNTENFIAALEDLRANGSRAVPGFMRPEGIVIFHKAASYLFKVTLEKDEQPKGKVE